MTSSERSILFLHFKDNQISSYSRTTLSAIFHLIRNICEDLPDTQIIPITEYTLSDFEQVINQYQDALVNDRQPLNLNQIQQKFSEYLLVPEKTSLESLIIDNNLELLRWILSQRQALGLTPPQKLCTVASRYGRLECLKMLHQHGCPWDWWTCTCASQNGHLECLQYAHQNGCSWSCLTCSDASRNGHLDCLQYAHQNGCPWDTLTCLYASQNGHLDCLQYACQNGCPWHGKTN